MCWILISYPCVGYVWVDPCVGSPVLIHVLDCVVDPCVGSLGRLCAVLLWTVYHSTLYDSIVTSCGCCCCIVWMLLLHRRTSDEDMRIDKY